MVLVHKQADTLQLAGRFSCRFAGSDGQDDEQDDTDDDDDAIEVSV